MHLNVWEELFISAHVYGRPASDPECGDPTFGILLPTLGMWRKEFLNSYRDYFDVDLELSVVGGRRGRL